MTSRERLLTVLRGRDSGLRAGVPGLLQHDPVPAHRQALLGYLPVQRSRRCGSAYLEAAKHFDIDALWDAYYMLPWPGIGLGSAAWERYIVDRTDGADRGPAVLPRGTGSAPGPTRWTCTTATTRPTHRVLPGEGRRAAHPGALGADRGGEAGAERARRPSRKRRRCSATAASSGVSCGGTLAFGNEEDIYRYYDNPDKHEQWAEERIAWAERRFAQIMAMEVKPDFLCVGGSGTLVYQTVEMFRKVALPGDEAHHRTRHRGRPADAHPLLRPGEGAGEDHGRGDEPDRDRPARDPAHGRLRPGGDQAALRRASSSSRATCTPPTSCCAARSTTSIRASRQAIDDAAEGGRFILSTGDQCGRDTPYENLEAMVRHRADVRAVLSRGVTIGQSVGRRSRLGRNELRRLQRTKGITPPASEPAGSE